MEPTPGVLILASLASWKGPSISVKRPKPAHVTGGETEI